MSRTIPPPAAPNTADDLVNQAKAGTGIALGTPQNEIGVSEGLIPQSGYSAPSMPVTVAHGEAGIGGRGATQTTLGTAPNANFYKEGDELGPSNLPATQIKSLQQALVQAGLLDQSVVHWGVWDTNSAAAYKTVLAQANVYGASAPDMLDALVQNAPAKIKGQKAAYALTNPLDIANQVSSLGSANTATAMTGQNLPAGETNAFVKWYQQQEAQARNAYNNLDLTTQTAYTDKPSLDAAAQSYIKAHNLDQVIAYGTASRALEFQQMLGAL